MSMKLLPASVGPVDPSPASDVSTSLVPLAQRVIATQAAAGVGMMRWLQSGQISPAPSADDFAWSSSTRRGAADFIDGTPVEDSQSDETAGSGWEYLSAGWAWSHSLQRAAIAHYLSYAAGSAGWSGRFINLYA
jgi:hypothetical protein